VQGDGEIPWVEFLDYVTKFTGQWNYEELAKIKALTYLDGNGEMQFNGYGECIPASETPLPDYDLLALGLRDKPELVGNYFREGPTHEFFRQDPRSFEKDRRPMLAGFWSSKGCVAKCTFCQRTTKGYSVFSLDAIDRHLQVLKDRYNVGFVQLIDENFGSNKKHAHEIARLMVKHEMLWACGGVRCTNVTDEDVQFYRDHQCVALKIGVESGSQKMLDLMEKRFTIETLREVLRSCIRRNIYAPFPMMVGMPGETDETARQTGRFIGCLAGEKGVPPSELGVQVFHALPLPGTPLYEYGQQIGLIGTTVEEEEEYLEAILDRGAGLANYINLNGTSLRRILYWETLLRLEATRTYYNGRRNGSTPTQSLARHNGDGAKPTLLEELRGLRRSGRFWSTRALHVIHRRLNEAFMSSRLVASLPRPVVDAVARNLNYLAFLLVRFSTIVWFKINKARGREVKLKYLFREYRRPVPLCDKDLSPPENSHRRSLRNIVQARALGFPEPATVTERNRRILLRGR